MSLSDQDLQKYVGQNYKTAQKEIESQGYKVHHVRQGSCATGYIPARAIKPGEVPPKPEKHVTIVYNGDDPEQKITSVTQEEY